MIPYTNLAEDQILLRPFHFSDGPALWEAIVESLDDLKPWMSWAHDGYERSEATDFIALTRARWEDGSLFGFAIVDSDDGVLLGACSLSHLNPVHHFCNLGYWVRSSRRGRNIAPRAARLAARFAAESVRLARAEIVVALGNTASLRAAEKSGATREGTLRNRIIVREQTYDAAMFSFTPQDFGLAPTIEWPAAR